MRGRSNGGRLLKTKAKPPRCANLVNTGCQDRRKKKGIVWNKEALFSCVSGLVVWGGEGLEKWYALVRKVTSVVVPSGCTFVGFAFPFGSRSNFFSGACVICVRYLGRQRARREDGGVGDAYGGWRRGNHQRGLGVGDPVWTGRFTNEKGR